MSTKGEEMMDKKKKNKKAQEKNQRENVEKSRVVA